MPIIIKSLFAVMPVFWLLLAIGGILAWRRRIRYARICLAAALSIVLIASTGPVPISLAHYLETLYEPLTVPVVVVDPAQVHVLVLGGCHRTDERLPPNNQLSFSALGRLIEGIRIHRMHPGSLLILSGFSGRDPVSNAEVMFKTALMLGVEEERMFLMPQPANTRQEAMQYKKQFGNQHPLIIVSSATHIPRAMIWFRKTGLTPVAAPTNHSVKIRDDIPIKWWLPSQRFIDKTDRVIYEFAGIVQAWITPVSDAAQ